MLAILHEKVHIAKGFNATAISLEEAPRGSAEFDSGAPPSTSSPPQGYVCACELLHCGEYSCRRTGILPGPMKWWCFALPAA